MTTALAIFVKTPGHSPVKTRLAERLGPDDAAECHRRCALAVAEVAAAAAREGVVEPHWAVAESEALGAWTGFPALSQGEGGLGERMARVHAALRTGGAAILVGADSPQIELQQLREAARWLAADRPRIVLGPARDGGFWLVGANRALPERGWREVAYSRADTAAAFRAAMRDCGEWLELGTLNDLDRAEDIGPVARELAALAEPTPAQRALASWLGGLASRTVAMLG